MIWTVLADHDNGIVMFDVPPPNDGVRGLDAYRETWPSFFQWQAQGATVGLIEQHGRWIVTHEHHSSPVITPEPRCPRRADG